MSEFLEVPHDRYALIADVVRRFDDAHYRLGKTALQKIVFLLQRSLWVDIGYRYTLYTYGPFCADVARDLDAVEAFGGARISNDTGFGGYQIHAGPTNDEIRGQSSEFLQKISGALDRLVADFGGLNAKELELRSTLLYLMGPELSREELVQQVHDVKPHFSSAVIRAALQELEGKTYADTATRSAT
ncbi:MAG TPA: hypothetical protein VIY49_16515 [Bryobacteraceae bacterium]